MTKAQIRVWLDDVRDAPDGWTRAYTAHEAIALLEAGGVVEISLDHNLGDDEKFGTGYDVACWIEERVATDGFEPPTIKIHSANSVGRAHAASHREHRAAAPARVGQRVMRKPRFTRSVLVVLDDGCIWFARGRLRRTRGRVRVQAESGVVLNVPTSIVIGSVSYAPHARRKPEPVAQLEDVVDTLQLGFDKELWRVFEERRRNPRLVPHEVARELVQGRVDRRRRGSSL